MAELTRPRALLFDWDNTLVDNWGVIMDALNATLSAMGQATWTLAETKQRVKASLRDSFPRMFGERWPEAEKIYYARFEAAHLERLAEMPGAGSMLSRLAERGLYLGVVSNKRGSYLRKEAAHLGWAPLFSRLVGAGDAAADKPAAAPVALALQGGPGPGPEVWFVGDTDMDMACARNSGCTALLLRREPPAPDEFSAATRPALHLPGCDALRQLIESL